MATCKRSNYLESEEGREVAERLKVMAVDATYNTPSSYSPNSDLHPDNTMSFVDKHMNYINNHPKLDATMYIANLRLMTRVR